MCVIDDTGTLRLSNSAAAILLKRYASYLRVQNGRIGAATINTRLAEAVANRKRSLVVLKVGGGRPLLLFAEPIDGHKELSALRLWRPTSMPVEIFMPLAEHFDLSPQQARVAAAIIAGRSVEQVASRLRIKTATVRAHLKVVYSRVGVATKAGLIAAFLRCVHAL